jgi:hypothetical protein
MRPQLKVKNMREYLVNDKVFVTICSVHDEITNLINSINLDTIDESIKEKLHTVKELTNVAKQMGQNMEFAIQYKNVITCGTVDFYNFQNFMRNFYEEEEVE